MGLWSHWLGQLAWSTYSDVHVYHLQVADGNQQVPLKVSPRAMPLLDYNTTYLKALYRGYTDSKFTERTEQPSWQGTQGPTLRSEVGDLVEIMFVNKLSKAYATMHSMGLQYSKTSEGSDYPNVTMPGYDETLDAANAVPPVEAGLSPGDCVVYKWVVPDIAGPNGDEPARVCFSILLPFHRLWVYSLTASNRHTATTPTSTSTQTQIPASLALRSSTLPAK